MSKKLITVIIPTYGRSELLIRSIDSVLNQCYPNLEIIVVDDNGRDTKNQISNHNKINNYFQENKIKYIVHEENRNGSAARNTGIKSSSGDYICFLDDDDEFLPGKVLNQYELLEDLDEEWVACYTGHVRSFDDFNDKSYNYEPKEEGNLLYQIANFSIDVCSGSTLMIRRELINKVKGFNENLIRHQDYEFLTRVAYYGKIGVISEPLVKIHVHKGSYSQKNFYEIEKTRLEYIEYVEPYLSPLSNQQRKEIKFINNYWLFKRSIFHRKYLSSIKYFLLCKRPLMTTKMLFKDSVKFLQKGRFKNV